MIQSKKLKKFKEISHAFFNKKGGKSKGIYKSLNCGLGSNDKIKNITKNIEKVCKKKTLIAYKHDGFWQCVDTKRDLDKLKSIFR